MTSLLLAFLSLAVMVVGQQAAFKQFGPNRGISEKYVALTFDDGPHAVLTPALLDSLAALRKAKNITAQVTFYVMGVKAVLHPAILRRAVAEGHEVANHAWNHPVLSQIPWDDLASQMHYTSQAIFNATGRWPSSMRPPYGKTNGAINSRLLKELHLPVILWSLDTLDWQRPSVAELVQRAGRAKPGAVLLCHDIHPHTVQAVPLIVSQLSEQGYVFKTVSELLRLFSPKALTGSAQPPPRGWQR